MSPPRKHLPLVAALVVGIGLNLPAVALAGAGSPGAGVHVDPSSPVAKEYALPLATARGAPADTGATGPLFGRGITKPKGTGPSRAVTSTTPATEVAPTETAPASSPAPPTSTTTAADDVTGTTPSGSNHVARHRHHPVPKRSRAGGRQRSGTGRPHAAKVVGTAVPTAMKLLHPGSGSSWLWMLVGALAVLAVGSAGAFLLVRVRQHDPKPN